METYSERPKGEYERRAARMRTRAIQMYNTDEPHLSVRNVLEYLKDYLCIDAIDGESIRQDVLNVRTDNQEVFVEDFVTAVAPLIAFMVEHPKEYEEFSRERMFAREGSVKINDIMLYKRENETQISFHITPHRQVSKGRRALLLLDGFKKLVDIVQSDESIQEIKAASWLVHERQDELKSLGFTILGEISEEERAAVFPNETVPIYHAVASRGDFLKAVSKRR